MSRRNGLWSGNRKGHGDPPLRKLLCFGEEVWRDLRGVLGREVRGGDGRRRRPAVPEAVCIDLEGREEGSEGPGASIEIELSEELFSWWEVERWDEIYEERLLWGDLSHEGKRILRKLLG
jgi:hypothetical protein